MKFIVTGTVESGLSDIARDHQNHRGMSVKPVSDKPDSTINNSPIFKFYNQAYMQKLRIQL